MNILSVNLLKVARGWWHDSSAAIICDGKLIAAIEQERLSRSKHDGRVPLDAISACLQIAGLSMREIDFIAFPGKPFRSGVDSIYPQMDWDLVNCLRARGGIKNRTIVHKLLLDWYFKLNLPRFNWLIDKSAHEGLTALEERFLVLPPIKYYDHHLSHAAASYFSSPFDQSAIATADGEGGPFSTVIWSAEENRITRLATESHLNSLGHFYEHCSAYLGWDEFGEGKAMGLAGYGDEKVYESQISSLLDVTSDRWYEWRLPPNEAIVGFPPRKNEPITGPPFPDFAAACQAALQRAMKRIARSAIAQSPSTKLCLGGGVALNCSSNGALLVSGIADSIWVNSAPGDAGLSIGAAALCAAEVGELDRSSLANPYLGLEFDVLTCEAALRQEPRVTYQRSVDLFTEVATALAVGVVVGWFQGRMEFGPRALGNRSILADPRTVEMRDRVNKIKRRELWRPLAPAILAERASEFFELPIPTPYMLFATKVRPEKRHLVPAIVHIDGTARPQTVTVDQNTKLYRLIQAFDRQTEIPILLNTSFNDAGEPIVCTPQDAIRTFLASEMDMLVCEDFIVHRARN
jgi:carbamoyltransferase